MAFCQNCGAQTSGEFCTACGAHAKTSNAPLAAAPNAAAATPRKTSPILWILVAVLGLFAAAFTSSTKPNKPGSTRN